MLIESCTVERSESPSQYYCGLETATAEVPREIRSLLPSANVARAISPAHLVVFPPEMPPEYSVHNRSKSSTPRPAHGTDVESSTVYRAEGSISKLTVERAEIAERGFGVERRSEVAAVGDSTRSATPSRADGKDDTRHAVVPKTAVPDVPDGTESALLAALKTAPERSYSPLPTFVDANEFVPPARATADDDEERSPMTMADALTTAPDRSYKLAESSAPARRVGNNPVKYVHGYNGKKTPVAPLLLTRSLIYSPASAVDSEREEIASLGLRSFPPVSDELKWSTAAGDFDRAHSDFEYVDDGSVFDHPDVVDEPERPANTATAVVMVTTAAAVAVTNDVVQVCPTKPRYPFTATGLHEPSYIPRYQQSIPENPHRTGCGKPSSGPSPSVTNVPFPRQADADDVAPAVPSSGNVGAPKPAPETTAAASQPIIPPTPVVVPAEPVVVDPMPKTSLPAALLSKKLTCLAKKQRPKCIPTPIPVPDVGGQPTGRTGGASAGLTAPRRGRGVLNPQNLTPGARVPLCGQCNLYIR